MHKKNNNSLSKNFIQGLRPLANTLPPQIKKILKKSGFNFSSIVDNWSHIVGKDISNKCYPFNIKAQSGLKSVTLILNVIHGKEIDIEYSKKNILDKINSYFGYSFISQIKIKTIIGKYPILIKQNILKSNKKSSFDNSLNRVKDLNLKNKLEKLIDAYNEKK
jgi:hypothetical protein